MPADPTLADPTSEDRNDPSAFFSLKDFVDGFKS